MTTAVNRPATPTSTNSSNENEPPEFISRPRELNDEDEADEEEEYPGQKRSHSASRRKIRYDSRIEQILHENPELPIVITNAGKNHESGGSYIVYTIRTGVSIFSALVLWKHSLTISTRTWRFDDGIRSSARCGLL